MLTQSPSSSALLSQERQSFENSLQHRQRYSCRYRRTRRCFCQEHWLGQQAVASSPFRCLSTAISGCRENCRGAYVSVSCVCLTYHVFDVLEGREDNIADCLLGSAGGQCNDAQTVGKFQYLGTPTYVKCEFGYVGVQSKHERPSMHLW